MSNYYILIVQLVLYKMLYTLKKTILIHEWVRNEYDYLNFIHRKTEDPNINSLSQSGTWVGSKAGLDLSQFNFWVITTLPGCFPLVRLWVCIILNQDSLFMKVGFFLQLLNNLYNHALLPVCFHHCLTEKYY